MLYQRGLMFRLTVRSTAIYCVFCGTLMEIITDGD